MKRPIIISCDFDGTVAYQELDEKPRVLLPHAKEVLAWIRAQGYFLILWTCRTGKRLRGALDFLEKEDVSFDRVNENWPGSFPTSRKIFADYMIDDHSFPIDWLKIKAHISVMPAPEEFNPVMYQDSAGKRDELPVLIEHQLATRGNRRNRKIDRIPRWRYPSTIEIQYRKYLLSIVDKMREEVQKVLIPQLPRLVAESEGLKADSMKMDSWATDLSAIMAILKKGFDSVSVEKNTVAKLALLGYDVNQFNKEEWYKICKAAIGIPLYSMEPELNDRLKLFTHDNTLLIKDVKDQVYKDIHFQVSEGLRTGMRASSISKTILSETELTAGPFRKVKTRARLIARDQVNKLNGDIAQVRQINAGISLYTWTGMDDDRERAAHRKMNNTLCRWDNADIYSKDGGKTWKDRPVEMQGEIPGSDYNCRCFSSPYFGKAFE